MAALGAVVCLANAELKLSEMQFFARCLLLPFRPCLKIYDHCSAERPLLQLKAQKLLEIIGPRTVWSPFTTCLQINPKNEEKAKTLLEMIGGWRQGWLFDHRLPPVCKGALILQTRFWQKTMFQAERHREQESEKRWKQVCVLQSHYLRVFQLIMLLLLHHIAPFLPFVTLYLTLCQTQEPASWLPIWWNSIDKLPRVNL